MSPIKTLIRRVCRAIKPVELLSVSEWCDRYLYLPPEGNAEPGKFHTARLPYQRAMLDDLSDLGITEFVWMIASQLGKTACFVGGVCYYIDHDPSSLLVVYPTLDSAKAWVKEKLNPTVEVTPRLAGKIKDPRSRDAENTTLNKKFPGGNLTICGANSPSGLRQRSKRVILQDEIDAFEPNSEGDPLEQADGRARNFSNAIKGKSSTPTIKHASRVENKFDNSDKQYFFCRCPKCQTPQTLKWKQLIFEDREKPYYLCENETCAHHWADAERIAAILGGEWKATAPFKGIRGRHLNGLYRIMGKKVYYPTYYHEFIDEFLKAKAQGKMALMVWTNIFLCETWEEEADRIEAHALAKRCESYGPVLPASILLLTAGVDVQMNRLAVEIDAWGLGEESWGVQYIELPGNPLQPMVWSELDALWSKTWATADGRTLAVQAAGVDTGGTVGMTSAAYGYLRTRFARKIFALKGSNVAGEPIVAGARYNTRARVRVYRVGTDTSKSTLYGRLRQTEPGPGYMHFPVGFGFDSEYFQMLTAEEIRTVYVKGFPKREWHKIRPRNEALDCRVYSHAALSILAPNFIQLMRRVEKTRQPVEQLQSDEAELQPLPPESFARPQVRHQRTRGWKLTGWR